jgi:hypothetical protein
MRRNGLDMRLHSLGIRILRTIKCKIAAGQLRTAPQSGFRSNPVSCSAAPSAATALLSMLRLRPCKPCHPS